LEQYGFGMLSHMLFKYAPMCSCGVEIYKLNAASPTPVHGFALHERAHGAQIALMTQEIRLLLPFTPEFDGVRERVYGLLVAADERATEVDTLKIVLFGLQVGDLANIITVISVSGSNRTAMRR
jgi:hypothetical protein